MKKFLSTLSVLGFLLPFSQVEKVLADWDHYVIKQIGTETSNDSYGFYKYNSSSGSETLLGTHCANTIYYTTPSTTANSCDGRLSDISIDQNTGNIQWSEVNRRNTSGSLPNKAYILNVETGVITESSESPWKQNYISTLERPVVIKNADGSIKVEVGGDKVIEKKSNGETHIGENSWITKEEGGRQKVYAKDAAGNPIPIDYTNGTKLLINGRDVEQSINNVGALSAALTGLPTVPTDTNLACGLGTGTHGGDFAFSGGCASKVNEKLSINYAASMTMPGQDYAGDFEDTFSARAGFVWKLGKSNKPTMISMKTKEKMEVKIDSLEDKNKKLENTVSTLMAKLERLEKVALGESKSKDLATIKLP